MKIDQTLEVEITIAPTNRRRGGREHNSHEPSVPDPPRIPRIARLMALADSSLVSSEPEFSITGAVLRVVRLPGNATGTSSSPFSRKPRAEAMSGRMMSR